MSRVRKPLDRTDAQPLTDLILIVQVSIHLLIDFQTPLALAVIHDDQVGGCVRGQRRSRMLRLAPLPHVDLRLPGILFGTSVLYWSLGNFFIIMAVL